jgi:hypothetical protein
MFAAALLGKESGALLQAPTILSMWLRRVKGGNGPWMRLDCPNAGKPGLVVVTLC